jgi:hypothetical protein
LSLTFLPIFLFSFSVQLLWPPHWSWNRPDAPSLLDLCSLCLKCSFVLEVLGLEPRALCLLTWATSPTLFALVIFQSVLCFFWPGPALDNDPSICTFRVAGITGMYHQAWP